MWITVIRNLDVKHPKKQLSIFQHLLLNLLDF